MARRSFRWDRKRRRVESVHGLPDVVGPGAHPVSLSKTTPAPTQTALYTIHGGGLRAYSREKLAVAYPLKAKDRAAAEADAILWTNKNIPVLENDGFYTGFGIAHTVATEKAYVVMEEGSVFCLGSD